MQVQARAQRPARRPRGGSTHGGGRKPTRPRRRFGPVTAEVSRTKGRGAACRVPLSIHSFFNMYGKQTIGYTRLLEARQAAFINYIVRRFISLYPTDYIVRLYRSNSCTCPRRARDASALPCVRGPAAAPLSTMKELSVWFASHVCNARGQSSIDQHFLVVQSRLRQRRGSIQHGQAWARMCTRPGRYGCFPQKSGARVL